MNSPGLLDSISSSFESLERLDYPFEYLSSCGFGVRSNSGRREKFTDYQRKVVVLNCLQVKMMLVSVYCICIFMEVFNRYEIDVRKRTSDIIPRYHSINNYYSVIVVFIISEKRVCEN